MNLTSATKFLYNLYNQKRKHDPHFQHDPQDQPLDPQDHHIPQDHHNPQDHPFNPQDHPLDPQDLSSDPQDQSTNPQDLNKLKQDIFNDSPNHYKRSQNNLNKSSIIEPIEFHAYMAETKKKPLLGLFSPDRKDPKDPLFPDDTSRGGNPEGGEPKTSPPPYILPKPSKIPKMGESK